MLASDQDTIIAQATAPGKGGVGIIRVSGKLASEVANRLLGKVPKVRMAEYLPFYDSNQQVLDQGIALFFKAPHSFTGEDVLELQGHGGQVLLSMLLDEIVKMDGVRFANPGEFSQRAFLNDKLDLTQAEAIADIIDASSAQAVESAMRSLQGEFSKHIHELVEQVIHLRMYVEAAIDFPEEEIDFLADSTVTEGVNALKTKMQQTLEQAKQGSILRDGMKVVIAGRPNAGKSSLLNQLAGKESAIVTDIAGTTRDVLREHIHIDGMPLHIIDTAGLRESPDKVEQIGIERAWQEIKEADRILLLVDSTESDASDPALLWPEFHAQLPDSNKITLVRNKVDLSGETPGFHQGEYPIVSLSANNGDGIEQLKQHLKQCMGYNQTTEGQFSARSRHVKALQAAQEHINNGYEQLTEFRAGELLAEELRVAQQFLNEITGEFSSDDLLGRIFSSFCIGK
ncbi:tRNA uridine-5-carboxymethylaminomethyl(34) synthesis GTPase MnmE [Planctobacterium marinum]|uniref:tRNA uridine-5-carboxymethylaminomethyl(34) synthesis GTPase MnmE n=1 Tax=Planctobacterium marinum TaxID=1631968 RepID=UPI001E5EC395|nr:tRNA uridine-5-carboxymethylaminomethyl(34) synthesis GTPase MnmE [Planctobacterium marinum]MCC2607209.1 tRNA uridine-5-carboxymethylaminomethyl(34) synthesis GTPase MnmE [Planctobacterium marinum]